MKAKIVAITLVVLTVCFAFLGIAINQTKPQTNPPTPTPSVSPSQPQSSATPTITPSPTSTLNPTQSTPTAPNNTPSPAITQTPAPTPSPTSQPSPTSTPQTQTPERIANLKHPLAPWAQTFTTTKTNTAIYFSFTQGFEAGYAGEGAIYSLNPETLQIKTEVYYSAQGAWWSPNSGPALGGSWGALVDNNRVYFGGYAINDRNPTFINVNQKTVTYLPDGQNEIWSLTKLGDTVYAATSFNIYTSPINDLHTWALLSGTSRRMNISENVIWGMTTYNNTLYAVSNFLYRYDFGQQKLVQLAYFQDMNTLKPILTWNDKLWFSGFGSSLTQNYTWLVSYDPATGIIEKWKVDANSITDLAVLNGKLYLVGLTASRIAATDYMRGNTGKLFSFDGIIVTQLLETDNSTEGLCGLVGFGDYLYFGSYQGDVFRLRVS